MEPSNVPDFMGLLKRLAEVSCLRGCTAFVKIIRLFAITIFYPLFFKVPRWECKITEKRWHICVLWIDRFQSNYNRYILLLINSMSGSFLFFFFLNYCHWVQLLTCEYIMSHIYPAKILSSYSKLLILCTRDFPFCWKYFSLRKVCIFRKALFQFFFFFK